MQLSIVYLLTVQKIIEKVDNKYVPKVVDTSGIVEDTDGMVDNDGTMEDSATESCPTVVDDGIQSNEIALEGVSDNMGDNYTMVILNYNLMYNCTEVIKWLL